MKKIASLLVLIILGSMFFTATSFAESINTAEIDIFYKIQELGYNRSYVDATDDKLTIKINANNRDFIADLERIFVVAYNYININEYNVEIFLEDSKTFTVSATREIIEKYNTGQIDENDFLNLLTYHDERSREEKLKTDLEVLGMIVYGLELDQNSCKVKLYYTGDDINTLIADIPNMHLLVIEHAPWVEKVIFKIENHNEANYLQLELQTKHILQLFEGIINHEEYYDLANISVEEMAGKNLIINNISSLLGGIKSMSILDIVIIFSLIAFTIVGYIRGFTTILIKFLSYFLAIIGARIFAPKLVDFLATKTMVVKRVDDFVIQRLNSLGIDMNLLNTELPKLEQLIAQNNEVREAMAQNPLLLKSIGNSSNLLANSQNMLTMLTNTILTATSMLVLFIVLKITISYFGKMIFKRKKDYEKTKVDRILGAGFGIITSGFIIALFAYFSTIINIIAPNTFLTELTQNSFIVKTLARLTGVF